MLLPKKLPFSLSIVFFIPALISLAHNALYAQHEDSHTIQGGVSHSSIEVDFDQLDAIQSLEPIVVESGFLELSIDGLGTNNPNGGTIQVNKPAGATVRRAYLAAATTGEERHQIGDNAISIDGVNISWDQSLASSINSFNYWADITSIVKQKIDEAPTGLIEFAIVEDQTLLIDGEILVVIFENPALEAESTIVLLFGAQNVRGDRFAIRLSEPITLDDPELVLDLSLGISYGYQTSTFQTQDSQIDVNGARITSSAGGADDGGITPSHVVNGSLLTVGGIGDLNTNPNDPFAGENNNPRQDDELYDLRPFVTDGDTTIDVFTRNPSVDDNIFFAALYLSSPAAVVGEGILLTPTTATHRTGENHTVIATIQDTQGNPIVDRSVTIRVISGPQQGLERVAMTDSNGRVELTYTSAFTGIDTLEATFVNSRGETVTSNQATHEWTFMALPENQPDLSSTKSVTLLIDSDGDNLFSGSDTIRYTITMTNAGPGMAMNATFTDRLNPYVTLVNGSVVSSQGTVVQGNHSGDTNVLVDFGNLLVNSVVTAIFDVQINDPIPFDVISIENRGQISCELHPTVGTNPSDGRPGATNAPIGAIPQLDALKVAALVIDADNDGLPEAGDVIEYAITILNNGMGPATTVTLEDTLNSNVAIIANSVQTSKGQVTTGNASRDRNVTVAIDEINAGERVTIRYQVRINDTLPANLIAITNQATIRRTDGEDICTRPSLGVQSCSPTPILLQEMPWLIAEKNNMLWKDANQDGLVSSGDQILYQISIHNIGRSPGYRCFFQ